MRTLAAGHAGPGAAAHGLPGGPAGVAAAGRGPTDGNFSPTIAISAHLQRIHQPLLGQQGLKRRAPQ